MTDILLDPSLVAAAAEQAAARSAAMAAFSRSGTDKSPEKPATNLNPKLGEFGGLTAAEFTTGGVTYPPGVFLPAGMVMGWGVKNRHALANSGRVSFFASADDAHSFMDRDAALAEQLLG